MIFKLPLLSAALLALLITPAGAADEFGARFANVIPKALEGESVAPIDVATEKTFSPEQLNEIVPAAGEVNTVAEPDPIPVTPYEIPAAQEQDVDTGE